MIGTRTRLALAAFMTSAILAAPAFIPAASADETSVKITSPKNGDTVKSPFDLKYTYHKGPRANHVHVYVDGDLYKPTHDDPVSMDLPSGKHVITVKAASKHHHILGPKDSITVNVQ
jgi:hypothetical protein